MCGALLLTGTIAASSSDVVAIDADPIAGCEKYYDKNKKNN